MFSCIALLVVSLMTILPGFLVFSCDEYCEDKPVFTPSRLVLKYGDPASASCSVCQSDCLNNHFGLEVSSGSTTENGSIISWSVDEVTEWDLSPICYYMTEDDLECCTFLPVTVYKPPANVSISLDNDGPMLAGSQYLVRCKVEEFAPAGNAIVRLYKGKSMLEEQLVNVLLDTHPLPFTYDFWINPQKEDHGAEYWCALELDLGTEGPQPPPVVVSDKMTATVLGPCSAARDTAVQNRMVSNKMIHTFMMGVLILFSTLF